MKRTITSAFTIMALAGAGLAATAGSVSAAPVGPITPAALSCRLAWNDANTAGITCTGGSFIGAAKCKNGRVVQGASAASGTISYAYCTSVNSSLVIPVQWTAIPA